MSIDTMELDTAEKIASIPIEQIDVARPSLFQKDTIGLFFDRLRKDDPVHYCRESYVGPYWSITKFDDIMAVDTNHKVFSSEAKLGGIAIQDMHSVEGALELEMFIAMDPAKARPATQGRHPRCSAVQLAVARTDNPRTSVSDSR